MSASGFPVFDGHNDTLLNLHVPERGQGRSFLIESDVGHIDLPRARRGGFAGGFFAIFVPPVETYESGPHGADTPPGSHPLRVPALDPPYAHQFTKDVIARLNRIEQEAGGAVRVVRTVTEIERCLADDVLAVVLHFEGAEAIHPDLGALQQFYDVGLRSLGIVWSRPNKYAHGVPFEFPGSPDSGPGLTAAGVELIRECNRLGVLVDLAHINERGFWDTAEHTTAPLIVTHGAAHALSPSSRNLTDAQLDAIGETDGVVGINFHVGFLREDGTRNPDMPLSVLVHHVEHAVNRIGIDHVALGSDFDGAVMSQYLGDVAGLPKLIAELQGAGYDDDALRKITHENWIRVLGETWHSD
jgi:membrane dipeptidase